MRKPPPPSGSAGSNSVVLTLKVRPGASATRVVGRIELPDGPALRVDVAAPPERGKANAELVRFLAKALGVGRGQLELVAGETSHLKRVRVHGAAPDRLASLGG
ncbi:MAG: DUF167 domain-containing protein [Planctomycetes bacterium]|nr:DUF167 domain-containing protein [Planctomycetota bacterium]